jgi:hypothetical protein
MKIYYSSTLHVTIGNAHCKVFHLITIVYFNGMRWNSSFIMFNLHERYYMTRFTVAMATLSKLFIVLPNINIHCRTS